MEDEPNDPQADFRPPATLSYERDHLANARPGALLKGIAVLTIGLGLWAIAATIGSIVNPPTHGVFFGAMLLVPVAAVLAVGQYLAVFRKRRREAGIVAVAYSVLAGFFAFATIVTAGDVVLHAEAPVVSYAGLIAFLSAAAALFGFIGIVQWRWWQLLRRHEERR